MFAVLSGAAFFWIMDMWADARQTASQETEIGFAIFPDTCPWSMQQALSQAFYPD